VIAYESDGETCRALPVIGGDDILGTALLFHRGALDDLTVRTFERSCSVIGIVLLSQHRAEASRNRGASALLRSLVSPRQDDPAVLADRAAQHGLDLTRPLALLVVEMDSPRADYAARRFGGIAPPANALADDIDGALVVLCSASGAHEVRQALATWVRQELKAVHRGVLSRPVARPAEIPALYATLRRALAVLGRIGVQGRSSARTSWRSTRRCSRRTTARASTTSSRRRSARCSRTTASAAPTSRRRCSPTSTAIRTPRPRRSAWASTSTPCASAWRRSKTCSARGATRRARSRSTSRCACGA
jgi:hypothetical protein